MSISTVTLGLMTVLVIVLQWSLVRVSRYYQDALRTADERAEAAEREVKIAKGNTQRANEAVGVSERSITKHRARAEKAGQELTAVQRDNLNHEHVHRDVANAVRAERAAAVKQTGDWVAMIKGDFNAVWIAFNTMTKARGCEDNMVKANRKLGRAMGDKLSKCCPARAGGASEVLDELVKMWADETEEAPAGDEDDVDELGQ